jgi:adenine-specific DNA-methyltransferase
VSGARSARFRTLPGLARAFRHWAPEASVSTLPSVRGADNLERHLLGALGGVAAVVAEGHLESWPAPLRRWATGAEPPPEDLMDGVRTALARGQDPLALLYDASISAANRRRLGTVFTPPHLVEHMVSLATAEMDVDPPECVVDPGAGVGAFTIAAARRWPTSRIMAVDVNSVTLGLLASRVAFEIDAYPETAAAMRRIEFLLDDYLDALPGLVTQAGPERILFLGNPPYTRVQELPLIERRRAARVSRGIVDNGHANLAVHFQAATLRHMRAGDVSCMVLPGSFSYTRASRGLRQALWNSRRRVSVQRVPATTRAFTGRSVQAAVLLIGGERPRRSPLELARLQISDGSLEVIDGRAQSRSTEEPANWFWSETPALGEESVALSEVAIIRRGVATGANSMFFLADIAARDLPRDVCIAAVPSLRGFDELELDERRHQALGGRDGRRWLLSVPSDYPLAGALRAYILRHKAEVSGRHLPSRRSPWYSIVDLPRPQVLVSPLSKTTFKVVLNTAEAVPSNNLIGITLRNGADPKELVEWLRSEVGQREMRRLSRRYHGGSHKLEPGDLCAVRIPVRLRSPR